MPVYLAPVLCVNSTSLTPSCNLALIVDEFSSLPILSKIMRSTMSSASLLATLKPTNVSPVQAPPDFVAWRLCGALPHGPRLD